MIVLKKVTEVAVKEVKEVKVNKPKEKQKKEVPVGCPYEMCGKDLCDIECGRCGKGYCLDHISNYGHKCFVQATMSEEEKRKLKSKANEKIQELSNQRTKKKKK